MLSSCLSERMRTGSPLSWPSGHGLFAVYGKGQMGASGDTAVLWLVLRGRVEVKAREGRFILGPREWIALDNESMPQALLGGGSLLLGVELGVDRDWPSDGGALTLYPGRGRMASGMRSSALRLWNAHGALDRRKTHLADTADIHDFLAALQGDLARHLSQCPGRSQRHKRLVLQRMQSARLYLEGQAEPTLSIDELARRASFSRWYFSKLFHALYGTSPLLFAARMRLEHAARLLATTRLPLTEVSRSCGFINPCSFARAFRAQYGMTASMHRKRHWQAAVGNRGPLARSN